MRKLSLIGLMSLVALKALSAPNIQVFVSFSMPQLLLEETLSESARLHMPAFLNGLIDNSMPKTVQQIEALAKVVPNLNLQIDPTAFERFGITQVPALVVDNGQAFDVLYGNLSISEGLLRIAGRGESGLTMLEAKGIVGG